MLDRGDAWQLKGDCWQILEVWALTLRHRNDGRWGRGDFICKAPLRGLRPTAPAVSPHEGRSFQLPAAPGPNALRPRPSPVGGSRTKRPATGRCGLRLPSPLTGAASNRPRWFRPTEGRSFQRPAAPSHTASWPRPSSVGGNRAERPATGRCGLHLPSPCRGLHRTAPGGFATEGRSFQLPAVSSPNAPRPRPPDRGWKPVQNARQLKVAGFVCKAP